jgi:hypothetical protein
MFDQMLDNFRKATESTLQLQQEMFRNWTTQWTQGMGATSSPLMPGMPGMPSMPTMPSGMGNAWVDQIRAFQKSWVNSVTEMLEKHRKSLDSQYEAGIKTIEDAFKVGEARDPEQFKRLMEQMWRHSFDTLKTLSESQMKDIQAATEKWSEAVTQMAQGSKI